MAEHKFSKSERSRAFDALKASVEKARRAAKKRQAAANAENSLENSAGKGEDKSSKSPEKAPSSSMPDSLKKLRAGLRGYDAAPERPSPENETDKAPEKPEENIEKDLKKDDAEALYPVSAAKEEEKARTTPAHEIGEAVEGKGIYLGLKELKDKKGDLVGLFDLYAAPEDLKKKNILGQKKQLTLTFHKAVSYVAELKDWHGYDGFNHSGPDTDADDVLYDAMRAGRYQGEWFIPPIDIVKNIHSNKIKGAFNESFVIQRRRKTEAHWYLSCSEDKEKDTIATLRMGDGSVVTDKIPFPQSVRCVRAEPRP